MAMLLFISGQVTRLSRWLRATICTCTCTTKEPICHTSVHTVPAKPPRDDPSFDTHSTDQTEAYEVVSIGKLNRTASEPNINRVRYEALRPCNKQQVAYSIVDMDGIYQLASDPAEFEPYQISRIVPDLSYGDVHVAHGPGGARSHGNTGTAESQQYFILKPPGDAPIPREQLEQLLSKQLRTPKPSQPMYFVLNPQSRLDVHADVNPSVKPRFQLPGPPIRPALVKQSPSNEYHVLQKRARNKQQVAYSIVDMDGIYQLASDPAEFEPYQISRIVPDLSYEDVDVAHGPGGTRSHGNTGTAESQQYFILKPPGDAPIPREQLEQLLSKQLRTPKPSQPMYFALNPQSRLDVHADVNPSVKPRFQLPGRPIRPALVKQSPPNEYHVLQKQHLNLSGV